MLFALFYALLRRAIGFGRPSANRELEIEVVVLRHQVKVLSRKLGRPKFRRTDKAFLAACSRVVPRHRWGSFIVAPSTLLRCVASPGWPIKGSSVETKPVQTAVEWSLPSPRRGWLA